MICLGDSCWSRIFPEVSFVYTLADFWKFREKTVRKYNWNLIPEKFKWFGIVKYHQLEKERYQETKLYTLSGQIRQPSAVATFCFFLTIFGYFLVNRIIFRQFLTTWYSIPQAVQEKTRFKQQSTNKCGSHGHL